MGEAVTSLKPGAGGGGAEGAGGARRGCSCSDSAMASCTIVSSSASAGMSSNASRPTTFIHYIATTFHTLFDISVKFYF